MEKAFAFGISGMFATVSTGVVSIPPLFAQADPVSLLGLTERLGLGAVMAMLGYKIIIKIIEVFGPPLLARLNAHDAEVQEKLMDITKKVHKIDMHLSGVPLLTTQNRVHTVREDSMPAESEF
jgi:hypothetical protein